MSVLPFFRETGSGPGVVCVHSNASSSGQWRGLMDLVAPRFHILAADTYGAGKSPPWPQDRKVSLRDEVALLGPVFARAGDRFSLVAHSYGGGIALVAAIAHRHRLRAMALYEPSLFAVVIDFWMGESSFDRMPERIRAATAESVRNMQGWKDALFDEPTPLSAFAELRVPVLYMVGKRSPLSSRAVAQRLTRVLPGVEVVEFDHLGHMGPVTHPDTVNEVISGFLTRC